jgi:hypothetical protein
MRVTAISLAVISAAVLGTLIDISAAAAAEIKEVAPIKVGDDSVQKLVLTGSIAPGDADKIEKLVSEDGYTILSLNGEGGNYLEALAIAKVLDDSTVMTIVEDGASCLSACAIAFLGGNQDTDDSGDYAAARSIAPTAKLGFTAPTLDLPAAGFGKNEIDGAYVILMKTVSDFVASSSGMYVEADAVAEILKPRGSETYLVNDVYRLAHIGVEVQKVAPPKALTASMARNLCQTGWQPTETQSDGKTDEAISRLKWNPADTTFTAKSDYFGSELPVKRTLVPFGFMDDNPDDGYTFCLVDQTMDEGALKVACRGFIYADNLEAGMDQARLFDSDPAAGWSGQPQFNCSIPELIEPPTPLGTSSPDNRWALVPGDTPLDKINETLAGYLAKEPAL